MSSFEKLLTNQQCFKRVSSTLGGVYPELERINHAVQQEISKMSVDFVIIFSVPPSYSFQIGAWAIKRTLRIKRDDHEI